MKFRCIYIIYIYTYKYKRVYIYIYIHLSKYITLYILVVIPHDVFQLQQSNGSGRDDRSQVARNLPTGWAYSWAFNFLMLLGLLKQLGPTGPVGVVTGRSQVKFRVGVPGKPCSSNFFGGETSQICFQFCNMLSSTLKIICSQFGDFRSHLFTTPSKEWIGAQILLSLHNFPFLGLQVGGRFTAC